MNVLLWILQTLLALHTVMGAVWKFRNPAEKAIPTLAAIPHTVWLGISVLEIIAAIALVLPVFKRSEFAMFPVYGAIYIAVVMVTYCGVHLASGSKEYAPLIYWLVVAGLCAFIAYGRMRLKPF